MSGGTTLTFWGMGASHEPLARHTRKSLFFLFIQIPKMPLSSLYNYKKKNHYEKTKRTLDSRFKFFAFTGIFVISLCVLIVYYFLYLVK